MSSLFKDCMRASDATRLQRARESFPSLFRDAPLREVSEVRLPADRFLLDVPSCWRSYVSPPGLTVEKIVSNAAQTVLQSINDQKTSRRSELTKLIENSAPDSPNLPKLRQQLEWIQPPSTFDELATMEAFQKFDLGMLPDGLPVHAVLVNMVCETPLRGSTVYVPWSGDNARIYAMSVASLRKNLYGIVTPLIKKSAQKRRVRRTNGGQGIIQRLATPSSNQRQYRISYRLTNSCINDINPNQLKLQETASVSTEVGYLTARTTTHLLASQCNIPDLHILRRLYHNRVYVSYLPPQIDLEKLKQVGHQENCSTQETEFGGLVMWNKPKFKNLKMLVFPRGTVICVGAKTTQNMRDAMQFFLPIIHRGRRSDEEGRGTKRRREEDAVDEQDAVLFTLSNLL